MKRSVAETFGRSNRQVLDDAPFVDWPDPKQLIGIEVELEHYPQGREGPQVVRATLPSHLTSWVRDSDGSLLNGVEYKLIQPLAGGQLAAAIHELYSPSTRIYRSVTSGTHIHINMDEMNTPLSAVQAVAVLVYAIEPALFSLIDPGRKWSGFTNPLESAPNHLMCNLFAADAEDNPHKITELCASNRAYKYYGLNVQTLGSYGTLEFRYFPTATNAEELIDWVAIVQSIKLAGLAYPTMELMLEQLRNEDSASRLLHTYLGRWAGRIAEMLPHRVVLQRIKDLTVRAGLEGNFHTSVQERMTLSSNEKYAKFFKNKKKAQEPPPVWDYDEEAGAAPRPSPTVYINPPAGRRLNAQPGDLIIRYDVHANQVKMSIYTSTNGWSIVGGNYRHGVPSGRFHVNETVSNYTRSTIALYGRRLDSQLGIIVTGTSDLAIRNLLHMARVGLNSIVPFA